MAHGRNPEDDAPEDPADPKEESASDEQEGQHAGGVFVPAWREGVEDMSSVELAAGDEVERGDEEAYPSGDQDGMAERFAERWSGGVEGCEGCVDEFEGEGLTEFEKRGDGVSRS